MLKFQTSSRPCNIIKVSLRDLICDAILNMSRFAAALCVIK